MRTKKIHLFSILLTSLLIHSELISAQLYLSIDCHFSVADASNINLPNQPDNTTLTWHNATPVSNANSISNVSALPQGIYYVAFYDTINDTYTSNITTVNVGPAFCIENACPIANVDLTTAISAINIPMGTILSYHTSLPASDSNVVIDPTVVESGSYYATFYDPSNDCYSGNGIAAREILVDINDCCPSNRSCVRVTVFRN